VCEAEMKVGEQEMGRMKECRINTTPFDVKYSISL
jgi:hypothetical protein